MSINKSSKMEFSDDFKEILKRISLFSPEITRGDAALSRVLRVGKSTPATWKSRGNIPFESIIGFAKEKNINIHWLLTGEGEPNISQMSINEVSQHYDIARSMYLNDDEADKRVQERAAPVLAEFNKILTELERKLKIPKDCNYEIIKTMLFKLATQSKCDVEEYDRFLDHFNKQEFAMIPGYNIQVSAGHGAINGEEQPTRYLAFRYKWLKYRGFNENDLAVVFAKGDSMEPTITNNNSLLIHTKIESILDGGIYVIRQDDTLLVKRVQRLLDGNLKLISDNVAYEPMILTKDSFESLDVVGQVVWIAKDIG